MMSNRALVVVRLVLVASLLGTAFSWRELWRGTVDSRRDYFVEVELASTGGEWTRIMWDRGEGYRDEHSSIQHLVSSAEPRRYRLLVPAATLYGLRFVPANQPAQVSMGPLQLKGRDGTVHAQFEAPAVARARSHGIASAEEAGDRLLLRTEAGEGEPYFEFRFPEPKRLPLSVGTFLRQAAPTVAGPAFAAMAVLLAAMFPPVSSLGRKVWMGMQARPRTTIALCAGVTIAWQCHPVIFFGRSFVSPQNGSVMLYGTLPTLPNHPITDFEDGMASDVGAILFHHLYMPMIQREALFEHGELPLWNRYSLGGAPLLGQGQSMFGNPLHSLTIVANGAAWAWDLHFVVSRILFVGVLGFTVWLLTRHLGAALLVTIASGFIGFYSFRLNHPANFSVSYGPLVLCSWVGLGLATTSAKRAVWALGLVVANWTVFTSGTLKEALMILVCGNVAGGIWVLLAPEMQGKRIRTLVTAGLADVGWVLLSAPLWWVFLSTLKQSYTSYDTPAAVPLPLAQWLGYFEEIIFRQNSPDEKVFGPALNAVFLIGVLAWLVDGRAWKQDRTGLALLLGALIPASIAFGVVPPALLVKVPFIANIIHVGNTFGCALITPMAVFAGAGFAFAARSRTWRRPEGVFAAMLGIAVIAAGFSSAMASLSAAPKSEFFRQYGLSVVLAFAVVVLALHGLLFRPLSPSSNLAGSGRFGDLRAGWVAALVLGLPFLLWRQSQYVAGTPHDKYVFNPGLRADFWASSPAVDAVNRELSRHGPGRVIGWDGHLFPAYNIALGWESLFGVDAVRSREYLELARAAVLERVWVWDIGLKESQARELRPIFDLLNVTHALGTHQEVPRTIDGFRLVASGDLDVFASVRPWPRAYFVDTVFTYSQPGDLLRLARDSGETPLAAIQVGASDSEAVYGQVREFVRSGAVVRQGATAASEIALTSNTTRFVVESDRPGIAVLSEVWSPHDFRATLNGREVPYVRVNHTLKAVVIPTAGRHEVVIEYRPRVLFKAFGLMTAGMVLLGALSFSVATRDERSG